MQSAVSAGGMLAPGTVFHAQYKVLRCLKAGGMGAVYEVLQQTTAKHRALKVMLPELLADADSRARFDFEGKATGKIRSEHIVEIIDAGVDGETRMPFLVMELLSGEDLGAVLGRVGRLPPADVCSFLRQTSLALDRTHAFGLVHRDLKPENLFLTRRDDGSPHIKILDFGIAKLVETATFAKTTRSIGTPLYMAPEQIRGDGALGAAVDLYALGQVALTLLTGEAYWAQSAVGESIYPLLHKITEGIAHSATQHAARLGVQLPPAMDAWFARAAAKDPRDRFETASGMIEALATTLGTATGASPEVALPAPVDSRQRAALGRPLNLRLLGAAFVIALVCVALLARSVGGKGPEAANIRLESARLTAAVPIPEGPPRAIDAPAVATVAPVGSLQQEPPFAAKRERSTPGLVRRAPAESAASSRAPSSVESPDPSDYR